MSESRLSPHFALAEFRCRDGTPAPRGAVPALQEWCRLWGEPLRAQFGPVRVLSGYRTEAHNRAVGGAKSSFHVYDAPQGRLGRPRWTVGVAVDVVCERATPLRWHGWATYRRRESEGLRGRGRGGIGLYVAQRFIHLDTGPLRDWRG